MVLLGHHTCVRLFRCDRLIKYVHLNEFLCCAFANIYILPPVIRRVRIGRQVAHLGPWRALYNYKEANLCVRLRVGRPNSCTRTHSHRSRRTVCPQRAPALVDAIYDTSTHIKKKMKKQISSPCNCYFIAPSTYCCKQNCNIFLVNKSEDFHSKSGEIFIIIQKIWRSPAKSGDLEALTLHNHSV